MFPSFSQVLLIHRLTPTHEAAEPVSQEFEIPLCHFLKDGLVVVVSKFLDGWSDSFETLAVCHAVPMFATRL